MKNYFKTHLVRLVPLVLIVLLASFFRLYGLNWDQGQHLHPDERFLTMVVSAMKIPNNFLDYLNPKISTMNPYNLNFSFFVYGTFPLYLTRIIGGILNQTDYWNIHFVGRILSALFDIGTVCLVYFIAQKIYSQESLNTKYKIQNTPLLAAFLYAIMVLPIQLSHFFAVDTFLNFFLVLSFFFLISLISPNPLTPHPHNSTLRLRSVQAHNSLLIPTLLGVSFGTALACKISALYFLPIIGLGYLYLLFPLKSLKYLKLLKLFASGVIFAFFALLVFRLAQPSAFSSGNFLNWQPNPQLIKNLNELKSYNDPNSWFPPAIQWKTTKPIIFPLENLVLWEMGLPLGIISIVSVFFSITQLLNFLITKNPKIHNTKYIIQNTLIVLWILGLFTYQGLQFTKTMRYFLPIYPFLALLSANFLAKLNIKFIIFIILIILIYPISFLSIYSHPITRVTASEWIYKNIPAGSTLLNEEWDDYLPLGLPTQGPWIHKGEMVFMYDWDTPEKWQKINAKLEKVDYIILTSNRAYGSTMKIPEKYPQTIKYYQDLFNSTGNFKQVAEFTSRPCFPPIGQPLFCFNDDSAEEAFTVYDHPKVIIFKRK